MDHQAVDTNDIDCTGGIHRIGGAGTAAISFDTDLIGSQHQTNGVFVLGSIVVAVWPGTHEHQDVFANEWPAAEGHGTFDGHEVADV